MTIASDIKFSGNQKILDNILAFDYALNVPKGAYFARNNFDEVAHTEEKIYHPKYNKLVKGTSSLFLTNGAVKISCQFENEIDMDVVSQFSQYITNDTDIPYQLVLEGDTLTYSFTHEYSFSNWQDPPTTYVPDLDNSYVEFQSESSNIFCVLRLDEDPQSWTPQLINIKSGDTLNITKEGSKCYVVFGGSVNSLESHKMYELTSDVLEATANEDVVAFRIFKND